MKLGLFLSMLFVFLVGPVYFKTYILDHHQDSINELDIFVKVKNYDESKLKDVKARMDFIDNGDYDATSGFEVKTHKGAYMIYEVPNDIKPGEYLVKFTVSGKDFKKTKYRWLYFD